MATRRLRVSLGVTPVGELLKLADGRVLFTFDPEYVERADRPVLSLSYFDGDGGLEGGRMLVGSGHVPPFFANLLPEGHLRSYVAARADVPVTREFEILELLGGDLPGAVRVHAADEDAEPAPLEPPVSSDGPPLRFSLAGVQLKFSALAEAGGGLTVPARGMGGDWIVKCPSMHYPGVTENEYSSMRLAAAVGIDVPEVRLIDLERIAGLPPDLLPSGMPSEPALAVRRFDRVAEGRVHMEDFGQVLERRPEDKYGPRGYSHIALPLGAYCDARSLAQFAARLMFSALVGNGDLHAKNWSLLYRDGRTPELSPAYDLLCTTAYIPGDTPALAIGTARRWQSLDWTISPNWPTRRRSPGPLSCAPRRRPASASATAGATSHRTCRYATTSVQPSNASSRPCRRREASVACNERGPAGGRGRRARREGARCRTRSA